MQIINLGNKLVNNARLEVNNDAYILSIVNLFQCTVRDFHLNDTLENSVESKI